MTPEQKADKIIRNLNDRSLGIEYLDKDIQEEIKNDIISIINNKYE
jgi:hypothetical protein